MPNFVSPPIWFRRRDAVAGALAWVFVGMALCASQLGCVQRRLTIRSNPPGALVYVDDYQIGTTPVSTDFVYYGTRKIRLVLSGYETLTVLQPIPTPWYEFPGLDFVSENLVPGRDPRRAGRRLSTQAADDRAQPASCSGEAENLRHAAVAPQSPLPPASPSFGPPPSLPGHCPLRRRKSRARRAVEFLRPCDDVPSRFRAWGVLRAGVLLHRAAHAQHFRMAGDLVGEHPGIVEDRPQLARQIARCSWPPN